MMTNNSFDDLFGKQVAFQEKVLQLKPYNSQEKISKLPCDSVVISSYHLQAMAEEFGELVKSDKRWKNYRSVHYDKNNKLEELADCFITLINIAIYSDIDAVTLYDAIYEKISVNAKRLTSEE